MSKLLVCAAWAVLMLAGGSAAQAQLAFSLDYSTYLGGRLNDYGYGIAADGAGGFVVAGRTSSDNFPTVNPWQASCDPNGDVFVSRFDGSGALVFSTLLGGSQLDQANAVAMEEGRIVVAGFTNSENFPTVNPFQASFHGGAFALQSDGDVSGDAFLSTFDSSGNLVYSTYFGGAGPDGARSLAVETGIVGIAGFTMSTDLPTASPYQAALADISGDGFVARFNSAGAPTFSTYLGGKDFDRANAVALEGGYIYVAGLTASENFPTVSPYQGKLAGILINPSPDCFLSKFNSSGNLVYSTFLGGNTFDEANGLAVEAGRMYIAGWTTSQLTFPLVSPSQAVYGGGAYDAFLSEFNSAGGLIYSTFLGGFRGDRAAAVAVSSGRMFVAGGTTSDDFPVAQAVQENFAGYSEQAVVQYNGDAFLSVFNEAGELRFSTYHGGYVDEGAYGIDVLNTTCYIAGRTDSLVGFPLVDPYQDTCILIDAFAAVFSAGRRAVVGDYNGDGTSDIALFRPAAGLWLVKDLTRRYFGTGTDIPVPEDYNGDRAWDIALFRPAAGKWLIDGAAQVYFGGSGDIPVPADYNGDSLIDVAVFRPSAGKWLVRDAGAVYYGSSADVPVPADYTGNGTEDIALFRPSQGKWLIRNGQTVYFGNASDRPVPADYTGDGVADIAVFRSAQGKWLLYDGLSYYFGGAQDIPVPADYDGDGADDIAVFRSSQGKWLVRNRPAVYFGTSTDEPVTNPYPLGY